jgi:hypothetical protein
VLHAGAAGVDSQFVDGAAAGAGAGGRYSLADGGWGASISPISPVILPDARDTYPVDPATVSGAGGPTFITRLPTFASNAERWKSFRADRLRDRHAEAPARWCWPR